MIKHFILPNSYSTRKTYNGEVYIYLGREKINIQEAFMDAEKGFFKTSKDITETFQQFIELQVERIKNRNPKFERFIFDFDTGSHEWEESAGFLVIGVRPETEKEIEARKQQSTSSKLAAKEKKKQLEIKERKELERLKKKYDAA